VGITVILVRVAFRLVGVVLLVLLVFFLVLLLIFAFRFLLVFVFALLLPVFDGLNLGFVLLVVLGSN